MSSLDVRLAREALTDDRFYKYRGCAPDPDDRRRAAGNPDLLVDAWSPPTNDGGEGESARLAREAAVIAVCVACPVMALCEAWASQLDDEGRLAEPYGVAGGRRALERHRELITARFQVQPLVWLRVALVAAGRVDVWVLLASLVQAGSATSRSAVDECRSEQKQAVLRALAVSSDADEVAVLAGLDTRTANWHRSKLCLLLGLDRRSATRMDLLREARRRGVLPVGVELVSGVRVAAAPTNDGVRDRRVRQQSTVQLLLPGLDETTNDDLMERAA